MLRKKNDDIASQEIENIQKQYIVEDTDGADAIVAKLKLCQTLEDNPTLILKAIKSKCRSKIERSKGFIHTALDLHLHKHIFQCVVELSPNVESVSFSFFLS